MNTLVRRALTFALMVSILLLMHIMSSAQEQNSSSEARDRQNADTLEFNKSPEATASQSRQLSPESTIDCGPDTTWVYGTGNYFTKICASEHGNITTFQSPTGFEHIRVGNILEGYTVSVGTVAFYDAGSTETGWGPPVYSTIYSNGENRPVITRRTTNTTGAVLELRQIFFIRAYDREAYINVMVRNISNIAVSNVRLARYFDGDIDKVGTDDIFDRTADSVEGRQGIAGHGMMLDAAQQRRWDGSRWQETSYPHATAVLKRPFDPKKTSPVSLATPTPKGDYIGHLSFNLGTLQAGNESSCCPPADSAKDVSFRYHRF